MKVDEEEKAEETMEIKAGKTEDKIYSLEEGESGKEEYYGHARKEEEKADKTREKE